MPEISPKIRHRLEIQGFVDTDIDILAETAPWLRLAFGLCTVIAATGTVMGSPAILLGLAPIAALGAIFPVHPFDLIYNLGIRRFTGTHPLPRRGAPSRFACGLGAVWLIGTAALFLEGISLAGYILGGSLVAVGTLVATNHICIPSMIYRLLFGWPEQTMMRIKVR